MTTGTSGTTPTITLQSDTSALMVSETILTLARPTTVAFTGTGVAAGQWVSGFGVPAGSFVRKVDNTVSPSLVLSSAITRHLNSLALAFKSTQVTLTGSTDPASQTIKPGQVRRVVKRAPLSVHARPIPCTPARAQTPRRSPCAHAPFASRPSPLTHVL